MVDESISRRDFLGRGVMALGAAGMAAGAQEMPPPEKILNYNRDMEYRRLGKTGLWVSAVSLGGHWKRLVKVIGGRESQGWMSTEIDRPDFQKNRADVVTRCIERGINYVDACCREEILAYSRALKGRRDRMYFGYSWHIWESRFKEWRSRQKLQEGYAAGLKEAGLEYADLWRISLLVDSHKHTEGEIEDAMAALEWARKSGLARFTGVSCHDRPHLKKLIETYPRQIEVILTPYTAKTKVVTDETGLWEAIRKQDVGWFGIKPFSSNALFKGDGSPDGPHVEEDSQLARLALRYILCNPAITAPIPGLISTQQVDNAAQAVKERRELDGREKGRLRRAMDEAWAKLPPDYQWLKQWEWI